MSHILPYTGQQTYDLHVAGTVRRLPLIQVAPDTWIAYYYSLGDTEVIHRAAKILSPKLAQCEVLITTEAKGIPLAHALATELGLAPYVVCRKEKRSFMVTPLEARYKPITATSEQQLYLDGRDAEKLRRRRVGLVDDIVSTGETLKAMSSIVDQAGGRAVANAALLCEGADRPDVYHTGILPIFKGV